MIFYFTGTGNSRYAAQLLAQPEEPVLFLPEAMKTAQTWDVRGKTVGFVMPVYYWGLPSLIADFMQSLQLETDARTYFYLVLTCGGSTGRASDAFASLMAARGWMLHARYSVKMVDNFVPMFKIPQRQEIVRILDDAERQLKEIGQDIAARRMGDCDSLHGALPAGVSALHTLYRKGRKTRKFRVRPACIGCGQCARDCPEHAIVMRENRPVWEKPQCVLCLRCLHHCPVGAIDYGRSDRHGRYVNDRTV